MDSGDIYLNTVLGDLWIVADGELEGINDPKIRANPDEVEGFVLVGHADVMNKKIYRAVPDYRSGD